jgi:acetoin utilization deacetylase AcuC-like enzyme
MARRLAALKKPLLAVLEGGYNVDQTALDCAAVIKGLLQEERLPE